MTPKQALGVLDSRLQRGDPQFVSLDPQHDFVPSIDAQSLTKGCRNYDASPRANTGSALAFHVPWTLQMTGDIL
jgi:hypothetical protein